MPDVGGELTEVLHAVWRIVLQAESKGGVLFWLVVGCVGAQFILKPVLESWRKR